MPCTREDHDEEQRSLAEFIRAHQHEFLRDVAYQFGFLGFDVVKDIAQEAMTRALVNLKTGVYDERGSPKAYLMAIARNIALERGKERVRLRARYEDGTLAVLAARPRPVEDRVAEAERLAFVMRSLRKLPHSERLAVLVDIVGAIADRSSADSATKSQAREERLALVLRDLDGWPELEKTMALEAISCVQKRDAEEPLSDGDRQARSRGFRRLRLLARRGRR